MSGAVTNPSDGPGFIPRLASQASFIQEQLQAALEQQSTGHVSQELAGLGTGLRTSLDLRPTIQHQSVWQSNIDAASGRLEVTQSVLSQINTIAQNIYSQVSSSTDLSTSGTIVPSAKQALQQVAQLLNTQVEGKYIFAGQDTGNPPLTTTDPTALTTALLASDTATPPFSATLGTAAPEVEVGNNQYVKVGLLANQNTLAVSAAPTTGSYLRDIMRALANLTTVTPGTNATVLTADTRTRLHSAIGALADESGGLGIIQADLTKRQTALAATQTTLQKQVSNAEDVDSAAVIIKVTSLQNQLQASYQLIAQVRSLSLSNYL